MGCNSNRNLCSAISWWSCWTDCRKPGQVGIQLISVVATLAYSFTISFIMAKVLDKAMGGIRVEEYEEIGGLDSNLHEESAYNFN